MLFFSLTENSSFPLPHSSPNVIDLNSRGGGKQTQGEESILSCEWLMAFPRCSWFKNWYTLYWRRQWHPTPVLLPGKSHGRRSLVGCSQSMGVAKSRTRLSDFTFTFHFHALEKEMATHSSVLAWRIPGTGEPDGLPSMGSHRVGHD